MLPVNIFKVGNLENPTLASGVPWNSGAQGKKWNWHPFSLFFPKNCPNGRPKTNWGHFQKWKAEKKKKKGPQFLFIHFYTSTKIYISLHELFWTYLWSLTDMCQMVGLLFFASGRFQRPLKVAPGARAPPPLGTPLTLAKKCWYLEGNQSFI